MEQQKRNPQSSLCKFYFLPFIYSKSTHTHKNSKWRPAVQELADYFRLLFEFYPSLPL